MGSMPNHGPRIVGMPNRGFLEAPVPEQSGAIRLQECLSRFAFRYLAIQFSGDQAVKSMRSPGASSPDNFTTSKIEVCGVPPACKVIP